MYCELWDDIVRVEGLIQPLGLLIIKLGTRL
jgi:hypothetical protein